MAAWHQLPSAQEHPLALTSAGAAPGSIRSRTSFIALRSHRGIITVHAIRYPVAAFSATILWQHHRRGGKMVSPGDAERPVDHAKENPSDAMLRIIEMSWLTKAIHVAVSLGIPDLLRD